MFSFKRLLSLNLDFQATLLYLDKQLICSNRILSTIVPLPPSVWNAGVNIIKATLIATRSGQKALRIAYNYILNLGYHSLQADEFRRHMEHHLSSTDKPNTALVPDHESGITEPDLKAIAVRLQDKLQKAELPPKAKVLVTLPLNQMEYQEIYSFIDIIIVLTVDPKGIPEHILTEYLDVIYKRLYPKTETPIAARDPEVKKIDKRGFLERNTLRLALIIILAYMIGGFSNYSYYDVGRFALFGGFALLFILECTKRMYWALLLSASGTIIFNPVQKLQTSRNTWIGIDKWTIIFLTIALIVEFFIWANKANIFADKSGRDRNGKLKPSLKDK